MGQEIRRKGGRPPKTESLAEMVKNAEAAKLRAEGMSYREVAAAVKCDVKTAHVRVQKAIAAVPAEAVEDLRALWGERLEEAYREIRPQLLATHVKVDHGHVVTDENDQPILDPSPKYAAAQVIVRLAERASRLYGMDMPVQVKAEVSVRDGNSELDNEITQLLAAMGRLEQGPPALEAPSQNGTAHPAG